MSKMWFFSIQAIWCRIEVNFLAKFSTNCLDIQLLSIFFRIDQDFHAGYRLWMITEPTDKFPIPELQQCLKLTAEPAASIREALIEAFTKSSIKEAKCWSGDRNSIGGAERHMSRLLYCLAFFHASLNERCTYGSIGGWSTCPTFSDHDLRLGVHYLEMMSREFDTINFEGLCELLGHCGYANLFMDTHDRALLETILDCCINEKAVSTNRYRFCVAVNDFFVPNKTLYKDYIEFIKALPSSSDHEVLDLDCSCQILNDKKKGTRFLLTLFPTLSGSSPYSKVGIVSSLEMLLSCVEEAIKAHDTFPFLKDGPLKWLWINEMTRHDAILVMAFQQLDQLNKCVRGSKVLDDHSKRLAETLAQGKVPKKWLGEVCKSRLSQSTRNFIRIITERTAFYKNINDYKLIQLDLIVKPLRLFTAIRFNYARKHNLSLHQVQLQATFMQSDEEAEQVCQQEDHFLFSRVTMLGAQWDYEKQTLVEKNIMHEYESQLHYTILTPKHVDQDLALVRCPMYTNVERTSSFLCYIPLSSEIPEDLVFKKGIMLAIDDRQEALL